MLRTAERSSRLSCDAALTPHTSFLSDEHGQTLLRPALSAGRQELRTLDPRKRNLCSSERDGEDPWREGIRGDW